MSKITIETKVLRRILELVVPAIETKMINKLAGTFLVSVKEGELQVRGNNSLIEATYTYYGPGFELTGDPITFCIEQFFHEIVQKFKTKNTTFEFKKNDEVLIKSGRSKHNLSLVDHVKFPPKLDVPEELNRVEKPIQFSKMFSDIFFAVDLTDWNIFQTFDIKNGKIIVTNGDQTVFLKKQTTLTKKSNPSAKSLLTALKPAENSTKNDEMYIQFNGDVTYLKYVMPDGEIEYNLSIIAGEFPKHYQDLIDEYEPKPKDFKLVMELNEFTSALDECLLYYSKAGAMKEAQYFSIVVKNNKVQFESQVETIAEFTSKPKVKTIELAEKFDGNFEVLLNPKELSDIVPLIKGDIEIVMYENLNAGIFVYDTKNTNLTYAQVTYNKEN